MSELGEGLRFLRRDRVLRSIMTTVGVTNFLDAATGILLPVFALEIYGSSVSLGLLVGAMAGGSVVAALVYAARGHRLSRRRVFALCFTGITVRYPVLALFPSLWVSVAGLALAGAAAGPINPVIDTVSYERVPAPMRGRVFGLGHAVAWTAFPVGVLLGGVFVEWVGLRTAVIAIGLAYLATTLSLWMNPALEDMDVTPAEAPVEVSGAG